MAAEFLRILDMADISLVQLAATAGIKLCLFISSIQILKHLWTLLCASVRSRRTGGAAHFTSSKASRPQAQTGSVLYCAPNKYGLSDNIYRFKYVRQNGSWRAYILRMPDLRGRDPSGSITHRLYDSGRPYICWDRPVMSLKDMKAISHVWADRIQNYIATGERFG